MDMDQVQAEIKQAQGDIESIVKKFKEYEKNVRSAIQDILVAAHVFDAVQALELEKQEVFDEAKAKVTKLEQVVKDLRVVEQYLRKGAPGVKEPDLEEAAPEPVFDEMAPEEPIISEITPEKPLESNVPEPASTVVVPKKPQRPSF